MINSFSSLTQIWSRAPRLRELVLTGLFNELLFIRNLSGLRVLDIEGLRNGVELGERERWEGVAILDKGGKIKKALEY